MYICRILHLSRDYCTKREVFGSYLADNPLHMHTLAKLEVMFKLLYTCMYVRTYVCRCICKYVCMYVYLHIRTCIVNRYFNWLFCMLCISGWYERMCVVYDGCLPTIKFRGSWLDHWYTVTLIETIGPCTEIIHC